MTRHPVIHSGYSIHDAPFKKSTVQGDEISHEKSSPKEERDGRVIRTYWRNNFILALAPFGLLGVPLQVLIPTSNDEDSTIANQNVAQWLKFRFRTPVVTLLTILECPAWMTVNYNVLSQAWRLLDHVVLQGLLVFSDVEAVVELVYSLPLFVMVNYTWLYGENIHAFIQSLDAPHIFEEYKIQPKKVPMEKFWIPQNNGQKGPKIPKPWLKELSFRLKLLKVYAIILVSHMVHFLTVTHRAQQDKWDSSKLNSYTIIYFRILGYLLIIPLFVTTCAAIGSQATATTSFIHSCIINRQRKARDLHLIKKAYERIADSILMANHLFSLFIPLVVMVFGFGALMNDMVSLNAGAASKVLTAWFTTNVVPSIHQTFAANSTGGPFNVGNLFPGSDQSGNVSFDNTTLNLEQLFQGIDANGTSNSTIFGVGAALKKGIQVPGVPPEEVRYLVGLTFQTLLYGLIICLAVLEAIRTNDKVRYIQIWINDLASEGTELATHSSPLKAGISHVPTNQDGQKEDEDFSREFTFLKFYVHSRMESEAPSQRALLNIRGLSLASGYLNKRLSGYPISH